MNTNKCPCCPATTLPDGYWEEKIETISDEEMVWEDSKHLNLSNPSEVLTLDKDIGNDSNIIGQLPTNYACCSTFQVLNEEGSRVLDHVLTGLSKHAKVSPRIPKLIRGGTFRSKFLNGMGHSPAVLQHVSNLAGCEMIYHPMKIHQLHINLKPTDAKPSSETSSDTGSDKSISSKQNVDRWHCDSTPFVLIVFCTNPDEYTGGELQYFAGSREEGMELLSTGKGLPKERIRNFGCQMKGFGVFMQGWRVFHQVTPVDYGNARTTIVFSFQPRNVLALEACCHLSHTYSQVDPLHVIMSDWIRFRCWKVTRRFEIMYENLFPTRDTASHDTCVTELFTAVDHSYTKLQEIVYTLPYSTDRKYFVHTLTQAITELKSYLLYTYPELMMYETFAMEQAPSPPIDPEGLKNSFTSVWQMPSGAGSNSSEKDSTEKREMTKSPPHSTEFLKSPYGLPNLLAAVEDVEDCIQDILTLKEHETRLVYF